MHSSPIRVCLVEDSSLVRLRLAGMLRDLWDVEQVFEAATVAESRRLLPNAKPHLVVVDMRLPDADALEVVAAAKHLMPQPAVAEMTNHRYDQLRATCREAGRIVGTLCVMDARPRAWTRDQLERLYDAAWVLGHAVDWRAPRRAGAEPHEWRRAATGRSTPHPSHGCSSSPC